MTISTIAPVRQTLKVTDVEDIQVTGIVTDDDGRAVRAIRFFGLPDGTDGPPVLEIILDAANPENIKVTTPLVDF